MNFHARPQPTLDWLVATATDAFEAWTFDDRAARQRAREALAAKGIQARIHSAYKPLLHFFLEDVRPGLLAATIRWPFHPAAEPNRFLLETYPLAALFPRPSCALKKVPKAASIRSN